MPVSIDARIRERLPLFLAPSVAAEIGVTITDLISIMNNRITLTPWQRERLARRLGLKP